MMGSNKTLKINLGMSARKLNSKKILSGEVNEIATILFSELILKITAGDAQAGNSFSSSLSICEDYAIVGAYNEDEGALDAGAAYFFRK